VISIQLWGPQGSVNSNCQMYVTGRGVRGASTETLAWLEQNSICKFPIERSGVEKLANSLNRPKLDGCLGV
jgi:hypothetical protein